MIPGMKLMDGLLRWYDDNKTELVLLGVIIGWSVLCGLVGALVVWIF